MRIYWVAHARGPDFGLLKRKGFLSFYPEIDDYVFLEVNKSNEKYLRKQVELGVSFLVEKGNLVKVTQKEIDSMTLRSNTEYREGDRIRVIVGVAANLDGVVCGVKGDRLSCRVRGWKRDYLIESTRDQIVRINDERPN